ncbi:hypothetical protein GCM10007860_27400 [Chitiniphilus shinanonensis]|uniref:Uncharacterized protein n=1 Tax=Chitiniphilus shinanonensis TaxID=553088 RepID=A0ABQ6C073_9NEIS|nr:hypothetical protein [Chitiniphilus shinanonensis]GLS05583.1 hypothetical protein GCM10007860_27400 [Chitiniphilus shinanonensis]
MKKSSHRSGMAIWGWPSLVGLLSGVGLVSGLFSDGGVGDVLAGVCLAVPVAVGAWFGWIRRGAAADSR